MECLFIINSVAPFYLRNGRKFTLPLDTSGDGMLRKVKFYLDIGCPLENVSLLVSPNFK